MYEFFFCSLSSKSYRCSIDFFLQIKVNKGNIDLLNWLRNWEIDCSGSQFGQLTCCAVRSYVARFFKKKGKDVFKYVIIK